MMEYRRNLIDATRRLYLCIGEMKLRLRAEARVHFLSLLRDVAKSDASKDVTEDDVDEVKLKVTTSDFRS